MKVAHTVPNHMLGYVKKHGYHLALAQHVINDPAYAYTYTALHANDAFIILDNGEAEMNSGEITKRIPFGAVVAAADKIGADEICMPDVFRDAEATLDLIDNSGAWGMVEPRRRMFIPQGEGPEEWMECLTLMARHWECRSFGIPKHMERWRYDGLNKGRETLCECIEKEGLHKMFDFHLLGVWNDPRAEILPIATHYPWVRGLDTGIAFAYAQYKPPLHLTEYTGEHVALEWDPRFDYDHNLAIYNMIQLEKWANAHKD